MVSRAIVIRVQKSPAYRRSGSKAIALNADVTLLLRISFMLELALNLVTFSGVLTNKKRKLLTSDYVCSRHEKKLT